MHRPVCLTATLRPPLQRTPSPPWIHVLTRIAPPRFTRLRFQLRLSSHDPQDFAKRVRLARSFSAAWFGCSDSFSVSQSSSLLWELHPGLHPTLQCLFSALFTLQRDVSPCSLTYCCMYSILGRARCAWPGWSSSGMRCCHILFLA